ncbi:hypothetical protein L1057_28000, partial [Escherichia coli]|nr:hypothetical protein [Escherichia coli]MCM5204148.1 hypothetical protein [Escherichia coli]
MTGAFVVASELA